MSSLIFLVIIVGILLGIGIGLLTAKIKEKINRNKAIKEIEKQKLDSFRINGQAVSLKGLINGDQYPQQIVDELEVPIPIPKKKSKVKKKVKKTKKKSTSRKKSES